MPAIRSAIVSLLQHALSENILFQHDADEVYLWLECLSPVLREIGALAPDGTPLSDEGVAIVTFLDDCALRCTKTPYKYLEELCSLGRLADVQSNPVAERSMIYPSPLIMTVVEQLSAKVAGNLLSPSDALAVASYIRKLLFSLAGKVQDLPFLFRITQQIGEIFPEGSFSQHPVVSKSIRREISILKDSLLGITTPSFDGGSESSEDTEELLLQLENEPTGKLNHTLYREY